MSWLTPDVIEILLTILKAVVILLVVVTCGAFMSFGERRLLGLFQNRYGPNRVGWGGSLQLVADMIKMFFKEDWVRNRAGQPELGGGRSEHWDPVLPDDGRPRGLRGAVRRLVEQQQILPAGGDARIRANPEL